MQLALAELPRLRRRLDDADAKTLYATAHAIRGFAAALGADGLASAAARCEEGDGVNAGAAVPALLAEIERALRDLTALTAPGPDAKRTP